MGQLPNCVRGSEPTMTASHKREMGKRVVAEGRVRSMRGAEKHGEAQDVEDDEISGGEDEAPALDPCLGGPSDLLVLN
jgi:hypothetical protein